MSKPEWQNWPEEPWSVDQYDANGDAFSLVLQPSPWKRVLACVNALAGRRNPAAAGRVIRTAQRINARLETKGYIDMDLATDLAVALAALDAEPDRNEVIQVFDYQGVPHGFGAAQDLHDAMREIKERISDRYRVTKSRITYSVWVEAKAEQEAGDGK